MIFDGLFYREQPASAPALPTLFTGGSGKLSRDRFATIYLPVRS
jgi:hypothetical protein